jgi:hypothetical protein
MNKKTFRVQIENVEIFSALMMHFNWIEIDRVATGGMMSQPELLLTFEGSMMLDHLVYVEKKDEYTSYFYNIDYPDGYSSKTVDEFYSNLKSISNIEIKKYQPK